MKTPMTKTHPIRKALIEILNSNNYTLVNKKIKNKSTRRTYYRGPKGSCYYINSEGKKYLLITRFVIKNGF